MNKPIFTLAALAAVAGVVFATAPTAPDRDNPAPTVAAAPDAGGTLVVDLVDGASEADLEVIERLLSADLDWTSPLSIDEALAEGWVADLDDAVLALADHPLVEVAEPLQTFDIEPFTWDDVVFPDGADAAGFPNDPMYAKQWHLKEMGAPAGYANTPMGRGVIVAVIDTGVTQTSDLKGTKVLEGKSFVPGFPSAKDDNGHGTHVAGTIAQTTNNGVGVAGVAPNATILPVKVLSKWGSGTSSWIASGIDYAVDEGADVINLSLGGGYSFVIHNAIKKARAKGVVVVAAAGNSGRKGVGYPGALKETIGVSATGPGGASAPYTSWGKGVDIAAPGGDKRKTGGGVLQQTVRGGGEVYAEFQGTSMATPHVAGAAAVLMSTGSCNADCVERTLLKSARGKDWDPKLGHGHLDLGAALSSVSTGGGGWRFLLGGLLALIVSNLAGASQGFRAKAAAIGAVTAGGLFFLSYLPVSHLVLNLLATSPLAWPSIVLGAGWGEFPLWLSPLLPLGFAATLGADRTFRPAALGFAAGTAAYMLHGAATGSVMPLWLGETLGQSWLALSGTACILIAMAMAGAENIERDLGK